MHLYLECLLVVAERAGATTDAAQRDPMRASSSSDRQTIRW